MPRFPEADLTGFDPALELFSAPQVFKPAHEQIEELNQLYRLVHLGVAARVGDFLLAGAEKQALLSGVASYEVIASVTQPLDVHASYQPSELAILIAGKESDLFSLRLHRDIEDAQAEAISTVPELCHAVRVLSAAAIGDSSQELGLHAISGAAIARQVQLDVDQWLAFERSMTS